MPCKAKKASQLHLELEAAEQSDKLDIAVKRRPPCGSRNGEAGYGPEPRICAFDKPAGISPVATLVLVFGLWRAQQPLARGSTKEAFLSTIHSAQRCRHG